MMARTACSFSQHLHRMQLFAAPAPHAALLCACTLLAGCSALAPRPATQIVQVPVAVPCVKAAPARPAYEFDQLLAAASDGEKILALARDWPRGRKYEGELEAVLAGCL